MDHAFKQRVKAATRDIMLKLHGRAETGDIYGRIKEDVDASLRIESKGEVKLPKVIAETLMELRDDARREGDAQLHDLADTLLEHNRDFEMLSNPAYRHMCITGAIMKKDEQSPGAADKIMDGIRSLPKTEEERKEYVLKLLRKHAENSPFLKKSVLDKAEIGGRFDLYGIAKMIAAEGQEVKVYDGENEDIGVLEIGITVGGKRYTQRFMLIFNDFPDVLDITTADNECGREAINQLMKALGFPPTVQYKDIQEPENVSVKFCLGHDDEEMASMGQVLSSDSANRLVAIENCKWTLDDFKTAD